MVIRKLLLCCYAIGGISVVTASSAFGSASIESASASLPTATRWVTQHHSSHRVVAFTTTRSYRCNHNGHDSIIKKEGTNIVDRQPKFSPIISSGRSPSSRLFMFPEHYDPHHYMSAISFIVFLPLADYLFDLGTFMVGLSFMFAATSFLIATPKEEGGELTPAMAAAGGGDVNITVEEPDELLTPGTYADSRSAKRQVKDIISHTALEAFDETDFEHEPHLSPELEDAEAAYEVALLASAAHELADAAEKENRQSKAAMLEREKELEWIEEHEDEVSAAMRATKAEAFQRSLLAAQIANNNSAKKKKAVETEIEWQCKEEEWAESEARGINEGPFFVAGAAATSAAVHALADVEAKENDGVNVEEDDNDDTAPATTASMLADAAERMIVGEDVAFDVAYIDQSPESSTQAADEDGEGKEDSEPEQTQLSIQGEVLSSEEDQWRKDYVQDIKSYGHANVAEQTKEKLSMNDDDGIGGTNNDDNATKELIVKRNESGGVLKRALKGGFMRRIRKQKRLLIVALVVVISRRLFLAYFGNGSRLL